jgi:hypothetical protein
MRMGALRNLVFLLAFSIVIEACTLDADVNARATMAADDPSTTTTSVGPVATTTITALATTTTTIPVGEGVKLVDESVYASGIPVHSTDLTSDPGSDFYGIGFSLPPGSEVRVPFDGYLTLRGMPFLETPWGRTEPVQILSLINGRNPQEAEHGQQILILASGMEFPEGTAIFETPESDVFTYETSEGDIRTLIYDIPVTAGDVIGVMANPERELRIGVEGQNLVAVLATFDLLSGKGSDDTVEVLHSYFPYLASALATAAATTTTTTTVPRITNATEEIGGDETPGSCLILEERWCSQGVRVAWTNKVWGPGPDPVWTTTTGVAFEVSPGSPLFAPSDGTAIYSVDPELGQSILTLEVRGLDEGGSWFGAYLIATPDSPSLGWPGRSVKTGDVIAFVSQFSPVDSRRSWVEPPGNYNLILPIWGLAEHPFWEIFGVEPSFLEGTPQFFS